jgi:hypothetical protein
MTDKLNPRHEALLQYIHANPGKTARQIATFFENHENLDLQATDNATRCAMRRLAQKGLIVAKSTKFDRQFPKYYPIGVPSPADAHSA